MPTVLLVFEFLGTTELLVIAFVALIIFGPRKLPEIGRKIGQGLAEFKRASEDFKRTWEYEVETERTPGSPRIEPETVIPRDSLTAGHNVGVGEETDATATANGAEFLPPEGETVAREAPDFAAAREAEPDDDAPSVVETSEPAPRKQYS